MSRFLLHVQGGVGLGTARGGEEMQEMLCKSKRFDVFEKTGRGEWKKVEGEREERGKKLGRITSLYQRLFTKWQPVIERLDTHSPSFLLNWTAKCKKEKKKKRNLL